MFVYNLLVLKTSLNYKGRGKRVFCYTHHPLSTFSRPPYYNTCILHVLFLVFIRLMLSLSFTKLSLLSGKKSTKRKCPWATLLIRLTENKAKQSNYNQMLEQIQQLILIRLKMSLHFFLLVQVFKLNSDIGDKIWVVSENSHSSEYHLLYGFLNTSFCYNKNYIIMPKKLIMLLF